MQNSEYLRCMFDRKSKSLESRAELLREQNEPTNQLGRMRLRKAEKLKANAEIFRAAEQFLYATEYADVAECSQLDSEHTLPSASRIFGHGPYRCGG